MTKGGDSTPKRRRSTSTSDFGVGRREGHDATDFYARFAPPELSDDATVPADPSVRAIDQIFHGSSADMSAVPDGSVALVVTSPPYFAGKAYETELDAEHVPSTYLEYLQMLRDVFAECVRVLEPGGRIAVNVANLGRRPFRSLSADVTTILQDDLRLLLRGEVVWVKQRGASGSCAWGSFQRATNPVLRDLTERVIIASKGRFDRAVPQAERARTGLPSSSTIHRDEFMDATLDLWEIPPESARRVGHPAPFPVALPERLINLYTYRGDLVLDPFMGSGSTAIAAVRTGRHYVGYDTDPDYLAGANERIAAAVAEGPVPAPQVPVAVSADVDQSQGTAQLLDAAATDGRAAKELALQLLEQAGFTSIESGVKVAGTEVSYSVRDASGRRLLVDVVGAFSTARPGLKRPETFLKALGKASLLQLVPPESDGVDVVFVSTDRPARGSAAGRALAAALDPDAGTVTAVVAPDPHGLEVLALLAKGLRPGGPDWPDVAGTTS